jgi:hypothetical protein
MHYVIAKGGLGIIFGIGLDTGRTVRGSSPGAADIFRAVHAGTEAQPAPSTMGTGYISRGKRPVLGADHPTLSVVRLQMGWSNTSASLLCLHRHVII